MIVTFFKHGKGAANSAPVKSRAGPIGYIFGDIDANKQRRSVPPELLRGDPDLFADLVDHGKHRGRYTSGVLRFTENDIPRETLQELMTSFESALLPGLEADQYSAVWGLHRDKGSIELHFVVAGEELRTGKRLNAYYHAQDLPRINAWKDAINFEYGFSDPNDPARARLVSTTRDLPEKKQERKEMIEKHILSLVADYEIKNRKDVTDELKKIGIKIARDNKNGFSIEDPSGGKNIRLSGPIFSRDFDADKHASEAIEERKREYERGREAASAQAREDFNRMHCTRAEANAERYKRPPEPEPIPVKPSPGEDKEYRIEHEGDAAKASEKNRVDAMENIPSWHDLVRDARRNIDSTNNNKELEKNDEPNESRSYGVLENLRRRIREARHGVAKAYQATREAFRVAARKTGISRAELQEDARKLSADQRPVLSTDDCIELFRRRARLHAEYGSPEG